MEHLSHPSGYVFVMSSPSIYKCEFTAESSPSVFLQKVDFMRQKISEILTDCRIYNWDGEGGRAVSPVTAALAEKIAESLPMVLDRPSLFPMANGKIAFQWIARDKSAFLLSVDDRGKITDSAILKDGERKNGSKVFLGTLPSDVREPLLLAAV